MTREELQAKERELVEKLKKIRGSLAYKDRSDVRKIVAIGAAIAIVVIGLVYQAVV